MRLIWWGYPQKRTHELAVKLTCFWSSPNNNNFHEHYQIWYGSFGLKNLIISTVEFLPDSIKTADETHSKHTISGNQDDIFFVFLRLYIWEIDAYWSNTGCWLNLLRCDQERISKPLTKTIQVWWWWWCYCWCDPHLLQYIFMHVLAYLNQLVIL